MYLFLFVGLVCGAGATWGVMHALHSYEKWAEEEARQKQRAEEEARAIREAPALQETPAFLALFEAFAGGAATLDAQGHFMSVNRALQELLGYSNDELKKLLFVNILHPQEIEAICEYLDSLVVDGRQVDSQPSFAREVRCFAEDGTLRWAHVALSVLPDANTQARHEPPVILALIDDVTRRRYAEGAVTRLNAGVHDLYRVVADQQLSFNDQMKALLSLGCRLFEVESGLLGKINGEQLEIVAVVSPVERLRVGRLYNLGGQGQGIGGSNNPSRTLTLPAPLVESSVHDWRRHPYITVTERETVLGAPIYIAGRIYGLLYFSDGEGRAKPFETEQTQFCQLMALWIGSEIERRQRHAAMEKEDAELMKANARLEAIATQDALTGVKNRRAFDEKLEDEFTHSKLTGRPLSMLLLDVDKFKQYNDSFGHPAGDDVLKKVGRLLSENVRDGIFVARYGGEEFAVILGNTALPDALIVAERLRAALEAATWQHRAVTASFGAAGWTPQMTERAQLIAAADGALYQSKEAGRNRVTAAPQAAAQNEAA